MFQNYDIIILILLLFNIILNIIIIYKIYHIKIQVISFDNKNDINDKKLYDTIKPIEKLTKNKSNNIKINNIDFSTKKDVYYYQNKNYN